MKCMFLLTVLTVVPLVGLSGCVAIPLLVARQDTSVCRTPLPEIPAPARLALERLTAGGRIAALRLQTIDGRAIYHVEATVDERNVVYDIAGDGTILTAGQQST